MNESLSSSDIQVDIESIVLNEIFSNTHFSVTNKGDLISGLVKIGNPVVGFQIDLYSPENNMIGEIYACNNTLLSGQKRKVSQDFLKLITINKLLERDHKLYYFLAMPSVGLKNPKSFEGRLMKSKDAKEIAPLGKDSWILKTAELFQIEIWYYFLDESYSLKLIEKRTNQKEGMKK